LEPESQLQQLRGSAIQPDGKLQSSIPGPLAVRALSVDPKKVLVGGAESVDWARRMQNKGISYSETSNLNINWTDLMRFKRTFTESVPKEREDSFTITELYHIPYHSYSAVK
jgi:hypothetical protein